jgi:hypothetical protein
MFNELFTLVANTLADQESRQIEVDCITVDEAQLPTRKHGSKAVSDLEANLELTPLQQSIVCLRCSDGRVLIVSGSKRVAAIRNRQPSGATIAAKLLDERSILGA